MRRFVSLGFVMFIFFIAFQCEAFAGSIKWSKNLDVGINCFNGLSQNESGMIVAVGDDGIIKTSADGIQWTGRKSGTTECLKDIVWGNNMFVAVGEGVILASIDGIKWNLTASASLNSVIWTGNKYIAVGKFGAVIVSNDGFNWTSYQVGASESLNDVYYNENLLIALGESGNVFTSEDGEKWSKTSVGFNTSLKSVGWNLIRYEIVTQNGAVLTSLDCKNWSWVLNETASESASKEGGKVNLQGALKLGDGLEEIIWDGKNFVSAGAKGGVYTSTNGINWRKKDTGTDSDLKCVIWTGSQYVAAGDNGIILTSPDLGKWTIRSSGLFCSSVGKTGSFKSVVWGKDKFVLVGDSGIILTSTDGTIWSRTNYKGDINLNKIIWTGKKYAAVGSQGTVLISSDGVNWLKPSTGIFSTLNSIAWSGKVFVAVGQSGEILTSVDGSKWVLKNTGYYRSIEKIVWDKSYFVAVESKNTAVLISTDGLNWTRTESIKDGLVNSDLKDVIIIPEAESMKGKVQGIDYTNQIIWDGTEYIGVGKLTESNVEASEDGNLTVRAGNSIMTSVDGMIWKKRELATCRDMNSIAWNGETLVAVGDYRTIISSMPAYIKVLINDKQLDSDVPPLIRNDRTLVPLRAIFEALGLSVGWDQSTKTITGIKDEIKITLKIDSANAFVNEKPVKLDCPATIIKERTMVPTRFIAESLGAEVGWDKATKTVIIKYLQ